MASSTTKKAVIRRFEQESLAGYVNPLSFLSSTGIELLLTDGNILHIPIAHVKTLVFVRDLDAPDELGRQVFQNRPKTEGLWVRLRFRDGDVMEGVMPNNLLQVEAAGFSISPPDSYGNQQRLFVPRTAVLGVEVLGVVGSPLRKARTKVAAKDQIGLFEE